jgi:hypothetical protein
VVPIVVVVLVVIGLTSSGANLGADANTVCKDMNTTGSDQQQLASIDQFNTKWSALEKQYSGKVSSSHANAFNEITNVANQELPLLRAVIQTADKATAQSYLSQLRAVISASDGALKSATNVLGAPACFSLFG